ncbi:hypothetical protein [Peptostreptococcus anaerobius]|uniref:hypothetical protein n=1 Tax=Peptostreptococcus anaerobius TaxID=1261 RepID=UPI00242E0090|nr:hypothetical protein [Peptostreptococcus anaerobius]
MSNYKTEVERTEKINIEYNSAIQNIFTEIKKDDNLSPTKILDIVGNIQSVKKSRKRWASGGATPVSTKQYEKGMCEYIKMPLDFKPSVILAGLANEYDDNELYHEDRGAIPVLMIDKEGFYMRTIVGVGHSKPYNHNENFILTIKNSSYVDYADKVDDRTPTEIASKRHLQFKYENREFIIAWSTSLDILRAEPLYVGCLQFGKGKVQYWIAFE